MEGQNRSARTRIWQELAQSEMCIWLMIELKKYNVGYNDLEDFCLGLKNNFKSENLKNKDDAMEEIVRIAMTVKLRDEKKYNIEMTKKRDRVRRQMEEDLGKNTKTFRREIGDLRDAATRVREEMKIKYNKNIDHLRQKHRQSRDHRELLLLVPLHLSLVSGQ